MGRYRGEGDTGWATGRLAWGSRSASSGALLEASQVREDRRPRLLGREGRVGQSPRIDPSPDLGGPALELGPGRQDLDEGQVLKGGHHIASVMRPSGIVVDPPRLEPCLFNVQCWDAADPTGLGSQPSGNHRWDLRLGPFRSLAERERFAVWAELPGHQDHRRAGRGPPPGPAIDGVNGGPLTVGSSSPEAQVSFEGRRPLRVEPRPDQIGDGVMAEPDHHDGGARQPDRRKPRRVARREWPGCQAGDRGNEQRWSYHSGAHGVTYPYDT